MASGISPGILPGTGETFAQHPGAHGLNLSFGGNGSSSPTSSSSNENSSSSGIGKDDTDSTPIQSDSPASSPRLEVVESSSDIEIIKNDPEPEMIHSNEIIQNNPNAAEMLRQGLLPNFEMAQSNQSSLNKQLLTMEEKPQRQCGVCYDKATGLHYGIISCEGCKGFFKRAISNRRIYRCVNGDEQCQMSRKDRNRCQFCRLKKCLHVGMNRKAIREDGMPGGRNKYTGPVNYSEEEVGDILTGREYANLPPLPSSSSQSPRALAPGIPQLPRGALPSGVSTNQNLLQLTYAPMIGTQMPYYVPNPQASPLSRNPKRRRSHASEVQGLPSPKNLIPSNPQQQAKKPTKTESLNLADVSNLTHSSGIQPVFTPIALQVLERLHEAEEKDILNFNSLWPQFKLQEKISKDQFVEAIPKIAEQSFTSETAWLRKAGLIDTIGVVDIFTLLSHSWQCLGFIRLLRFGQQLENFNSLVSKYEHNSYDMARFAQVYPLVLKIAQLYTKVINMEITDKEYAIIKVLCVVNNDFSKTLEAAKHEVAKLQNLYLFVARTVFGNDRTIEILTVLADVRLICDQMKNLDLSMMLLLIRIASATCWEMHLKNKAKQNEASPPIKRQNSPNAKSYDSASPHSSGDVKLNRSSGDENESGVASVSDVTFCPSSRILNASLAMHFERQFSKPNPQLENSKFNSQPESTMFQPKQESLKFNPTVSTHSSTPEDRIKSELYRVKCEPINESVPQIFVPNLSRSDEEEEIEVE